VGLLSAMVASAAAVPSSSLRRDVFILLSVKSAPDEGKHPVRVHEWEANAPLREAMAIKRERLRALRAKRAEKQ
jgi:hypothetical protein